MFKGEKRVVLYLVHLVRFYFGLLVIQISSFSTGSRFSDNVVA